MWSMREVCVHLERIGKTIMSGLGDRRVGATAVGHLLNRRLRVSQPLGRCQAQHSPPTPSIQVCLDADKNPEGTSPPVQRVRFNLA